MTRELTQAERERAERMRADVKQHMPEMLPIIRDLVESGLIDGWRNVRYCGPAAGGPKYRSAPSTLWPPRPT